MTAVERESTRTGTGAATPRRFLWVALALILLLAGVGSYYASSAPDGLNAVAARLGFSGLQQDSASATSPLSGYDTAGVSDHRLSVGLAGVIGVLVTLVAAWAMFRWLGRPRDESATDQR